MPVAEAMDRLLKTLELEQIEVNLFRGFSPPQQGPRIYGGQVVAQALMAAYKTIEGRTCHSLQSYFIRPGDPKAPVLFQVERSRDGRSFTTRRVIAIQHGEQIFNMACSFQIPEQGLEHQIALPDVPPPESLETQEEIIAKVLDSAPAAFRARLAQNQPFEMRPVHPVLWSMSPEKTAPVEHIWMRARRNEGDDLVLNQALLAWVSDMSLLSTALRPHGYNLLQVQTASLDHHVWFHRHTNMSEWHLYALDSPTAAGARGFNRGTLFRHDGTIVASMAQEGLMRVMKAD